MSKYNPGLKGEVLITGGVGSFSEEEFEVLKREFDKEVEAMSAANATDRRIQNLAKKIENGTATQKEIDEYDLAYGLVPCHIDRTRKGVESAIRVKTAPRVNDMDGGYVAKKGGKKK